MVYHAIRLNQFQGIEKLHLVLFYCINSTKYSTKLAKKVMALYFIAVPQSTCDWIFSLALKAPVTTAADNKFWDIFPNFQQK